MEVDFGTEAGIAAFDASLARLLAERFPDEPLLVPHRISALIAWRAPDPVR